MFIATTPIPFFVFCLTTFHLADLCGRVYVELMADTFSQIYIHIVFAVEGRQNLLRPEHREHLHRYITGIVTHQGQKLIAINSMPDHIHILVGLKPSMAISDLVAAIKRDSSAFIN